MRWQCLKVIFQKNARHSIRDNSVRANSCCTPTLRPLKPLSKVIVFEKVLLGKVPAKLY